MRAELPLPPSPVWDQTVHKPKYEAQLPGGLPEDAWTRILAQAAGADGILGALQQRAVVRWAMEKQTLSEEKAANEPSFRTLPLQLSSESCGLATAIRR